MNKFISFQFYILIVNYSPRSTLVYRRTDCGKIQPVRPYSRVAQLDIYVNVFYSI